MASLFRGSARQAEAFAESFDVAGGTCAALAPRQPLIRVQTYYGGFAIFKNRCALLENSRRYKERGPAVTSGFIKIQQACQSDRVEKDEEEGGGGDRTSQGSYLPYTLRSNYSIPLEVRVTPNMVHLLLSLVRNFSSLLAQWFSTF